MPYFIMRLVKKLLDHSIRSFHQTEYTAWLVILNCFQINSLPCWPLYEVVILY